MDLSSFNTTVVPDTEDNDGQRVLPYYDEWVKMNEFIAATLVPYHHFQIIMSVLKQSSPLYIVTSGFGIFGNVINVLVFYRQGILTDSCTTTLAALAVSDLTLSFLEFFVGVVPWILVEADRNHPGEVFYTIEGHPMKPGVSSYILVLNKFLMKPCYALSELGGWITAYLAVERMVSVAFPFRVKAIFSPKISCIVAIFFFLACFLLQFPRLLFDKVIWYDFYRDGTTFILLPRQSGIIRANLANAFAFVNKTVLRTIYIGVIVICNVIIAIKVNTSQKFRKSMTSAAPSSTSTSSKETSKPEHTEDVKMKTKTDTTDGKTNKELRLVRILYLLSITFLISRVPNSLALLIYQIQISILPFWGRRLQRRLENFYYTLTMLGRYLLSLNGATNILMYFALSKKYREIARQLFSFRGICKKK